VSDAGERTRVGLCFTCRNARLVETPRSRFWMCRLSATDPRFDKYPRLPVLVCDGYERQPDPDSNDAARRN
jgi:hypothetical protein